MNPRPPSLAGVCIAGVAALLLAACAGQSPAPAPGLAPPQSESMLFELDASGDQIYECTRAADGALAWVFRYPQAVLRNAEGFALVTHGQGPSWTGDDGSRVVAEVVSRQDAPRGVGVPWLLLRVTQPADGGVMGPVMSIQRVDTRGGLPPPQACDETLRGQFMAVPYTARYRFFGVPLVVPVEGGADAGADADAASEVNPAE